MPLNKLENFIKNTEGRILYVNPNDLDSTDSITNQGNSLAQPFKTVQRALLESARFSYLRGYNNDITEKTTILLFPGEHLIDNRPGYAIYDNGGVAYAVPTTGGVGVPAAQVLSLELNSSFDLTDPENILHRFNSINGGVIVPRGTSIVGLDLRKTKLRPKYIPNPTDSSVPYSAIFRITGACYFWQLSIFDGDETGLVYTNPTYFTDTYQSTPSFSHHKLTVFEYADGVNVIPAYDLTDLDIYYSKVSNAYNTYRNIDSKFPAEPLGFSKRAPEWEIVGAFASDPIDITNLFSGNGTTAGNRVTVTTATEHNLNVGTPIKLRSVSEAFYNVSTKVQEIVSSTQFTYLLPTFPINLDANPSVSGATVTVETDTVSGASPYIFNCSMRSVWGMNGMTADGSKASGFRSMVVAQYTAVSLQKDDRAFVKYDETTRSYNGINIEPVSGAALPLGSSETNPAKVYHLDQNAIYRNGWESSHIKIQNDSFIQIVSVFAIGFNKHFDVQSGGDASITNSNSNFGQISLNAEGFKKDAFAKDNKAFITSIIPPRDINPFDSDDIEWLSIDVGLTTSYGNSTTDSSRLYLYGFTAPDGIPVSLTQGYRVGARKNDILYFSYNGVEYGAKIYMTDPSGTGLISAEKSYRVIGSPAANTFTLDTSLNLLEDGEKVIINSAVGDLPENITEHTVYYAIKINSLQIQLAASYTNAILGNALEVYGGTDLTIKSRVSDKNAGDIGSPIQYDTVNENWYIKVEEDSSFYNTLNTLGVEGLSETTDLSYVKRVTDGRALDEKLYKVRVVIPAEFTNSKNPESGFVLQESSSTGVRNNADFNRTSITQNDYDFQKNPRFIAKCQTDGVYVTVTTELPHNLKVGDIINVKYVTDSSNPGGDDFTDGYNGKFRVVTVDSNNMSFTYSIVDVNGISHIIGTFTNNLNVRSGNLPRYERNDLQSNIFIYRNEVISTYIQGKQNGIYHLYLLNASNAVATEFTNLKYSQNSVDLYPQLDRDNYESNPESAVTYAKRSPIGDIVTSDLKNSVTRETIDKFLLDFNRGLRISSVSSSSTSATITINKDHNLSGVVNYSTLTGGSGKTAGTYYNVKLYNENTLSTWNGATAKVTVSGVGNSVTAASIIAPGSGYSSGNTLYFDSTVIGGSANAYITLATAGISTNVGDVVQISGSAGVGRTSSSNQYYRITSIPDNNRISIAKTSGDSPIFTSQYAFIVGPSVRITSTSYDSTTGILTIICPEAHGLVSGNKFRILDSSNNNLGDYVVNVRSGVTTFTTYTYKSISATNGYILKHGMSANEGVSDKRSESLATRGMHLYANETLKLVNSITTETSITVLPRIAGISSIAQRFPLGSYIQLDNEIMRITSSGSETTFGVIRGSLGTLQEPHDANTLIRKISPIAVEFRRPSILRASGHTFEYMGFGPGNYSTGLPQVQIRSLTEREEFLSQAQERSCGAVIYTGMNNKGDVFSGNTKTIASSGEVVSYDIPNPTVTGQDPTKLSVVFDEVTVKERLLVEGGVSAQVLSQFNGPLTLNGQVRVKAKTTFSKQVKIIDVTPSISRYSGALVVNGGVGILLDTHIGGIVYAENTTQSTSVSTGSLIVSGGAGISRNVQIGGTVYANNTTESTSVSTGSLVVAGGVGISSSIHINGIIYGNNTIESTSTTTGSLQIDGGAGIVKNIHVGGLTYADNTTESSGISTGSLIVAGGAGIAKNVYIGGNLSVATSKSTTLGGTLSVVGNTNLSGNLGVAASRTTDLGGSLTVDGATTLNSSLVAAGSATVNALNINTSGMGQGDLGSSGGSDGIWGIYNTANGGETRFILKNAGGSENQILRLTNTSSTITGTLSVSGAATLSSSLSVSGTLSASGAATLSSSLSVSSDISSSGNVSATGNVTAGNRLIGQLQRSIQIVGTGIDSTFNNTANVTVTLPDKTKITVSGSYIDNGFRGDMTATPLGTANTLVLRGQNGGTNFGSGGVVSAGDITAFASDERLKTNIEPIQNGLDKVLKLRGFTYNFNEIGEELGFDSSLRHSGVSAQEVQAVLPEAVCPAPASDEYLTVKYEKLVPLLIEAIKELKEKIDELKKSN